ncbi:hypothetical protein [Aridibaculum aurantiacum]|uniref:hypothetical protein n=1 Tax=Aridibaculum aurantiacum TaxID=2810307 RepID=UPI001A9643CB|nr:hypothetical protein [Aridibaculum aurantiacum]
MTFLRLIYRNLVVEAILLMAVCVQVYSGLKLFKQNRRTATAAFDKLHIWSGLYLAIFFVIHVSAVFTGRIFLHLDTNFYFGVAGMNSFPTSLFFIPYYTLALLSFFGHIAAVHNKKMKRDVFGCRPVDQSKLVLAAGICTTVVILYGLTNHFHGFDIPAAYNIMIGK